MEHEASRQLLLKLLALAERMERRDARVIELLTQQAAALQAAAQGMETGGQRFARDALDVLRAQGREAVHAGVGDAAAQCREHLLRAAAEASRGADEVRGSAQVLRRQRGFWAWSAPLALIVGSVLATIGAGYAVVNSRAQVERHRIEAALLRAYNRADVTLCGGQLCANIDERGGRHGDRGQYRPVEPRASAAP